jgi:hypothetical protein
MSHRSGTLPRKREEHGRLGRVETDPLARAMPMRTTERSDSHRRCLQLVDPTDRRDACAPLQKSKNKLNLVLLSTVPAIGAIKNSAYTARSLQGR